MRQRRDHGIEVGLAGLPAHRCDRAIGHIHARVAGFQDRRRVDPAGVVRMEMNGNPDLIAQCFD